MSNLSNLHISGSYKGLINLEDSTQPLVSQSGDINLQDGLGDNVGLKINAQNKRFTVDNDLRVDGNADFNGNVDISGSWTHTGSIDVLGNVTVNGNVSANIATFDTVNTRLLHVTEESSSVIFSSGSNVLGDEDSDTQTLNGSVYIPYKEYLSGSTRDTETRLRDLTTFTASQETINSGYNTFTQSVDNKFSTLQTYTASVDVSLSALNSFTSSQLTINGGYNSFTASANQRLTSLENFTSSLVADFVTDAELTAALAQYVTTASYDIDSASFDTRIDSLDSSKLDASWTSSVFTPFSSSVDSRIISNGNSITNNTNRINALSAETGSYARLDAPNNFSGSQIITGSVGGNVTEITVTSFTASIDCSQGNFFTIPLFPTGSPVFFEATNITPGQTISVKVTTQANTTASMDPSSIRMIGTAGYSPSQINGRDILTFVSFDSSFLYGVPGLFFG